MRPSIKEIRQAWKEYEQENGKFDELFFKEVSDRFRKNGFLTPIDLYLILIWKLESFDNALESARAAITKNSEKEIRNITATAIKHLNDKNVEEAIRELSKLNCVKERVASAILTFYDPVNYGVMDVHAFKTLGLPEDYSPSRYASYLKELENLRKALGNFSCHQIEAALYMLDRKKPTEP
jgi:hypothetical protein